MAAQKQRHWAQWVWLAAGLALAVRVAFIFWGHADPAVPAPPAQSRPRVTVVTESGTAGGPLVKEQMELFDQQPLSMPTIWNAGAQGLPADLRRQPGEVFGMYEPRLTFAAERLEPVFGPSGGAPTDGRGGLRMIGAMAGGWAGLGRHDRTVPQLPVRDAAVEVRRFSGGLEQVVLREPLQGLPDAVREHDWPPVEFSVAVMPAGLVGVPTLTVGSGVEEVDAFFGGYLARDFRLGERVGPGFYRVCIVR
jgi:hypothetical protein